MNDGGGGRSRTFSEVQPGVTLSFCPYDNLFLSLLNRLLSLQTEELEVFELSEGVYIVHINSQT